MWAAAMRVGQWRGGAMRGAAITKWARRAGMAIFATAVHVLAAASGHCGSPAAPPVAAARLGLPVADVGLPGNENGGARLQDTRITVLLWLAPGRYGIRRHSETADPVLCLPDGCFVSGGRRTAGALSAGTPGSGLCQHLG